MMRLECHVSSLILALFVIITTVASRKEASGGLIGGWTPISNVNDPHFNKQSGASLKLEKIIKGDTQVVSGTNYRLILSASSGFATSNYEAIVWEKPWQNFRSLTSFNPAHA
ncbi:hypothetical protein AAHE18_01G226800 [Arachis hypogaea]